MTVEIRTLRDAPCNAQIDDFDSASMICTRNQPAGTKDICAGDSGKSSTNCTSKKPNKLRPCVAVCRAASTENILLE